MSQEVFKPKFWKHHYKQGPKVDSRLSALNANKNLAAYFTYLTAYYLEGSKVVNKRTHSNKLQIGEKDIRYPSPDIVQNDSKYQRSVEVKAVYDGSSKPHCSIRQFENGCFSVLNALKKAPLSDYQYFMWGYSYGDSHKPAKHHELTKKQLTRKLAAADKHGIILPLNLALPLYLVSGGTDFDHSKSLGANHGNYWGPWRTQRKALFEGKMSFIQEGLESHIVKSLQPPFASENPLTPEDFFLDKLKVNHWLFEPIRGSYHGHFEIPEFEVTEYSLSEEDQATWLKHFSENHQRILGELNLRDVFQMRQDWLAKQKAEEDEVPF